MKPSEVTQEKEKHLLNTVYNHIKMSYKPKFKVGGHVRIFKVRGVFDKMYKSNWSTEIFTIKQIQYTNPTTYLLQDESNEKKKIHTPPFFFFS